MSASEAKVTEGYDAGLRYLSEFIDLMLDIGLKVRVSRVDLRHNLTNFSYGMTNLIFDGVARLARCKFPHHRAHLSHFP